MLDNPSRPPGVFPHLLHLLLLLLRPPASRGAVTSGNLFRRLPAHPAGPAGGGTQTSPLWVLGQEDAGGAAQCCYACLNDNRCYFAGYQQGGVCTRYDPGYHDNGLNVTGQVLYLINALAVDCLGYVEQFGPGDEGAFLIQLPDLSLAWVYCDFTTDGGGWTVFQRRQTGTVDFDRGWADYKAGFGDLVYGDFWLGNDLLHLLTFTSEGATRRQLRVDLWDAANGDAAFAVYADMIVYEEDVGYELYLGDYDQQSTAGDAFPAHSGVLFSTWDVDNNQNEAGNAADTHQGAWWYGPLVAANLNGPFATGVFWEPWKGPYVSLTCEMKIRRKV